MPTFRYRALTQSGEVVHGTISAPTAAEVAHRIEYLSMVPIDTLAEVLSLWSRPRPEDVTVFTGDLALLLKAGARIHNALELLAADTDMGRQRGTVAQIQASVMAGETFADSIAKHPDLIPGVYVALVRVGEASGTLDNILESINTERVRTEAMQRKPGNALRYPAFVLIAACCVLTFCLFFVLPRFATVLRDFNAKLDPVVAGFLWLSDTVRANADAVGAGSICLLLAGWLVLRRPGARGWLMQLAARLPLLGSVLMYCRTTLFCRNLGVLLANGVTLTSGLRTLTDMMVATGDTKALTSAVDRVRQGGKLSEARTDTAVLPPMAVRMLRLGEETGQLPMLAGRVADLYEAKLQRSLDRVVAVVGPVAIITISIIVGGLIVSVMTALLSVSRVVG